MKIAIVGAHRETKLDAPYNEPDWKIWTCSNANENELPRHDIWFELHDMNDPVFRDRAGPVYLEWLKTLPFVYMQKAYEFYPGAKEYPLEKIIGAFGPYFLSGTISYMMALAILQKPETIGLWGFGRCPEYQYQQQSILYFVQTATDRGIEVISPSFPALLKPNPLYGYEWYPGKGD